MIPTERKNCYKGSICNLKSKPVFARFLSSFLFFFGFFLLVKDSMPCGHIFFFPKKTYCQYYWSCFLRFLPAQSSVSKLTAASCPFSLKTLRMEKKMTEELIGRSYCSELADLVWLVYGFICSRQTRNQFFIVDVGREIYKTNRFRVDGDIDVRISISTFRVSLVSSPSQDLLPTCSVPCTRHQ